MIKNLLFSLGIIGTSFTAVNAQITITMADVAGITTVINSANDTLPTVNPGPAGANVTWNFSSLQTNLPSPDTMIFTNPFWTPNQAAFPTSNLAIQNGANGNNGTIYTIISGGSFKIIGQNGDFGIGPINVSMNPQETIINFPATYNTTFNSTSGIDFRTAFSSFPIDSVRLKEVKTKTSRMDAWGTITTPLLSNQSCLRQRNWQHTIDTIWVHDVISSGWQIFQTTDDTTINFSWWANGIGFPLVQMDSVSYSPYVQNASWLMATPVNGVNEYSSVMNTSVYPNPAVNVINVDVTGLNASYIHIMDISGREIEKFNVNNDIEILHVDQFAAGAYLFSVTNKAGEMIGRGKFNVIK